MSTIGLRKIKYSDDVKAMIDSLNKNFAAIENLLANGNLDETNMKQAFIDNLKVNVANIVGELVVGENVDATTFQENIDAMVNQAVAEKKRVFTTQPVPPYSVGDLWVNGYDIKKCDIARNPPAVFTASDWSYATNYTNPTGVTTIINGVITTDYLNAIGISASAITSGRISADHISTSISTVYKTLHLGSGTELGKIYFHNNAQFYASTGGSISGATLNISCELLENYAANTIFHGNVNFDGGATGLDLTATFG